MRLFGAMRNYAGMGVSRFHMPGHKGVPPLPGIELAYSYDVTEIAGMDSLYEASGPILSLEKAYAGLYGSRECILSAGGSTLCVQGMLAAALLPGDRLLCCRGVHVSAARAMALLDLDPVWLFPEGDPETGLALPPSAREIEAALDRDPKIRAVYLTSPTYCGVIADIAAISQICRKKNRPLLIDNAHGAHLAFLSPSLHPIALGAALCADSLHKTLPVLTGGALLHVGDAQFAGKARQGLALFGSTSPSYLIMGSADAALDYLRNDMPRGLAETIARLSPLKALAREKGLALARGPFTDPARLSLGTEGAGYSGGEFGEYLRGYSIEPEYAAGGRCVLMASPFNSEEDWRRLEAAIAALPDRPPLPITNCLPNNAPPQRAMRLREAVFADCERIPLAESIGRIAGDMAAPCPPGIALVVAGELISPELAAVMAGYGIEEVRVVIGA